MRNRRFWQGIAIMTGCIIGGGVLALPYAVAQSGFWSALLLIVIIGLIMMFVNLRIGEMNCALKKPHQVVGLVERFVGKTGKKIMIFAMLLLSYGALIAYTIGSAQVLALIGLNETTWRIIFYISGALIVAKGIKTIGGSELFLEAIKLTIVGVIVMLGMGIGEVRTTAFTGFTLKGIGMVFGISLFAYLGLVSIPAVYKLIQNKALKNKNKQKNKLKKIIIIGSTIPIIVYVLFVATAISKAENMTEVATIGLQHLPFIGALINIFALLALATSFLAVSYSVYAMFTDDMMLSKKKSFIFAFLPPAIGMFFMGSFAKTIDLTGALAGSTMTILLVLAHRAAAKKHKNISKVPLFIDFILISIFILGVVFVFA
ncbi:hypothetical protein DRJ25_01135 [Candidatus Woesearchaeota archaeon]|nr:MAG: hypothetical protein DRJ25_01135 [Candidatus Woesearchaeota archaeon]